MWYILDRNYKRVGTLNDDTPNGCPVLTDLHTAKVEYGFTSLEFSVPSNHKTASLLDEGFVVYEHPVTKDFELFRILNTTEAHGDDITKVVKCEAASTEDLRGEVIQPKEFTSENLSTVATFLLLNTGWELGECYYDDLVTIDFLDYPTALQAIQNAIVAFDAEIKFKVEWSGTKIIRRVVNLRKQVGNDTKVPFEYGRNLNVLRRDINRDKVFTALYGVSSQQDGNGKQIAIVDAKWTPPDPFEKVDNYIGDLDALEVYGRTDPKFENRHVYGVYSDSSSTNPVQLAQNTLAELKKWNKPQVTYEADVVDLQQIKEYDHMKALVGDTVRIKDTTGDVKTYLDARILEKTTSVTDPTKGSIVLGEYVLLKVRPIAELQKMQNIIKFREAEWTQSGKKADNALTKIDEVKNDIVHSVKLISTNGTTFKNGVVDTDIVAVVFKGKDNITTTLDNSAFTWKKFKPDGTQDTTWIADGVGKQISIDNEEVDSKGMFQCEITVEGKVVAVDRITIIDINDAIITGKAPQNPAVGELWIDSSVMPAVLYNWDGSKWTKQTLAVGSLDPELLATVGGLEGEVEDVTGRVTTAESTISQLNTSITSKVDSTTFNSLKDIVDTQKSTIEQQAGQISSKVEKNGVISSINQTAETVKIGAEKIDIVGFATFFAEGNPNKMPARMDSFEQIDIGTLPSSMFLGTTSLTQKAITSLYSLDGSRSIVLQTSVTDDGWLYLAPSSTNYNIPLTMGATYIFSFYAFNPDLTKSSNIRGAVKLSDASFLRGGTKTLVGSEGWYRYEVKFTVPAGVTACNAIIYNYTANVPIYFDCFQMERVDPNAMKASPWKPVSTTIINGGNVTTQSIVADHIKSLNGLNVNGGQFVVDTNGNVTIGEGATLTAAKFAGLRGNTIYFGDKGAKIDVTTAGTINRARFGVNDSIYVAIDDNNNFNFVMDDGAFNPKFWRDSNGHRLLTLGSANIAGLSTGSAVHIRNGANTDYAKLAASDIIATSSLDVWGGGGFKGDVSITSNGGLLKLNGSTHAYIEVSYGGTRKGFIGTESATGSNMVIASDKDEIIFKTDVCRVKIDNGTARVDFKNANDSAYIPIYASNITYNSVRERKKDIEPFVGTEYPDGTTKTALQQINETPIRTYRFVEELNNERKHVGLILDESPVDVIDIRGEGIDAYAMGTYSWSAIQELSKENQDLRSKNADLEARLAKLEQLIS